MSRFVELFLLLITTVISIDSEQRQCQSITYYECKNIGYNQTYLPNKFNHQDQKDVALVVSILATDVSRSSSIVIDLTRLNSTYCLYG
jgi:hypothetical protein